MENLLRPGRLQWSKARTGGTPGQTCQSLTRRLEKLKFSKYDTPEDLAAFSQRFDEGVKKVFSVLNSTSDQYVRFISPRDNDPKYEIRAGRLTLKG